MQGLVDWLASYDIKLSGVFLNIVIAIIIVLIGFILGRLLGRLIKRALHEAEVDNILKKIGLKISVENKISVLVEYFIYIISIIMALNQLGVTTTVLQIVLAGVVVLIVLFAFISLKDFVPNIIAGFFIHRRKLLNKGDYIEIHGIKGKVENIGLVETEIIMKSKDKIYVPNSNMIKSKLKIKKSKR
ncbi:mechanosensitive ion channel family protein [Candidatus Woesearchaeota archaeon]|nr:mechanosensitive ion channel family protein [Candidatus Woesearchaeota archaeon]